MSTSHSPETPETVVARMRPHGRALFWPTLALALIAGATSYFFGRFPLDWENLALLAIAALLVLLLWGAPLVRWLGRNCTITTRRIILRSGILIRARQEVLLSRIHDVTVRKNGLQTVFGSGDVHINSGSGNPLVLRDVPKADLVQAALHDLMEATDLVGDGGVTPDDGFRQAKRR
jgi:membrane protein YdbS with pleckstrin-like domain